MKDSETCGNASILLLEGLLNQKRKKSVFNVQRMPARLAIKPSHLWYQGQRPPKWTVALVEKLRQHQRPEELRWVGDLPG
jgi:hypothetical protein